MFARVLSGISFTCQRKITQPCDFAQVILTNLFIFIGRSHWHWTCTILIMRDEGVIFWHVI